MGKNASGAYLAFTPDTDPEHARAVFLARYGREAAEVIQTGGALLVGPVTPPTATPPSPAPSTATQLSLFKGNSVV